MQSQIFHTRGPVPTVRPDRTLRFLVNLLVTSTHLSSAQTVATLFVPSRSNPFPLTSPSFSEDHLRTYLVPIK
jgi:hypothetical protein